MGLIEALHFWRRPDVKQQEEEIRFFFKEDGTLAACEVNDTSDERWQSALSEKVRVHDLVTNYLAELGLINPDNQHIKLGNPQTINSITRFEIELLDEKPPVNLSILYPLVERRRRQ